MATVAAQATAANVLDQSVLFIQKTSKRVASGDI
jgi:hypothetical protein